MLAFEKHVCKFPISHILPSWPQLRVLENRIRATAGIGAARQSTAFRCSVCARVPPPSLPSYSRCAYFIRLANAIDLFYFFYRVSKSCSLLVNAVFRNIIIIIPSHSQLTLVTIIYAINVILPQVSPLFTTKSVCREISFESLCCFFLYPNHKKKISTAPAHSSTRCTLRIRKRTQTNLSIKGAIQLDQKKLFVIKLV